MVKTYSYKTDKNLILSPHFKAGEFYSNINGIVTDYKILIDTDLIDKLEQLISALGATKAVVTSGYRDSKTDIEVNGNGKGYHTKGMAADIIFYDKDNKTIDTRLVSCVAQDLGFGGIARISERAIHLDTRTGKRYLGDETVSTNSVTTDFYKYYGIKSNRDIVKEKFGLADDTMLYLDKYKYAKDLYIKLAK